MKKKTLFLLALFSLFLVTGCGEKKEELAPLDVLTKAVEKFEDAKSLEVTATAKVKVTQAGTTVDMQIPVSVSAVEDGDIANAKLVIGENPAFDKTEMYYTLNQKDESMTFYLPSTLMDSMNGEESETEEWYYYNVKLSDLNSEETEMPSVDVEKVKNIDYKKVIGDNFVYVDSNEDVKHYQLTFNQALVERLATELGETVTEDMKFDFEFKLDFYIDKDYNLIKVSSDLKDLMSKIASEETEEMPNFEELSFTIEFKNVNNTTVTIPEEIKNNAIDLGKIMQESQEQMKQINDCYERGGYWDSNVNMCVDAQM